MVVFAMAVFNFAHPGQLLEEHVPNYEEHMVYSPLKLTAGYAEF